MEFILILALFFGHSVHTTSILFPNAVACEIALEQSKKALGGGFTTAKGVCVPRQAPGVPK